MPNFSFLKGVILTLSVGCGGYVVGGVGGVEESTLRLNSAQFQLKLPAGAELGKNITFLRGVILTIQGSAQRLSDKHYR